LTMPAKRVEESRRAVHPAEAQSMQLQVVSALINPQL